MSNSTTDANFDKQIISQTVFSNFLNLDSSALLLPGLHCCHAMQELLTVINVHCAIGCMRLPFVIVSITVLSLSVKSTEYKYKLNFTKFGICKDQIILVQLFS